ncbi:MAG: hypothetical protein IPH93_03880 [Saprospiraceae bacterium]|nr:hypothetical protein [Saprospiraceae bacterium]
MDQHIGNHPDSKEYYDFKYSDLLNIPFILKSKLSNQEILELYKESIDKIPYLKYLASIHHEDFKIIPIRELNNGKSEEGFLFRIRSNNGNVLIIWENVNEARATFVFKSNEDYLDDDLAAIESYIVDSNLKNKRLFFHILDPATAPIKLKMKFVKSIDHRRIEDYQKDIEKLIQER